MIPEIVYSFSNSYPSGCQEDRCYDIIKCMDDFDIVCFNESFGGIFSEIREKMIGLLTKAGFFYIAADDDPEFLSTNLSDGGLMIVSRFPIVSKCHHPYSYS
jgi:hypothetical protein